MSDTELTNVGQQFIVGLQPTPALHQQDRQLLRDLHPSGVILYKSNFHHDRPCEESLSKPRQSHCGDPRGGISREVVYSD
jgi:hypothetical protein